MNKNINLTEILKDCPIGWKFYSSIYGNVTFCRIENDTDSPIVFFFIDKDGIKMYRSVTKQGLYDTNCYGECTFFPSKDQRDWSKFTAPWYNKPIEQKFHIGQYITDGYVSGQIIEDDCHCYKILDFMGGINTTIPFTLQDNYHLWTIQDAKDGDVLALSWLEDENLWEKIIIFKKYHSEGVKGLYSMPCVEGYGKTFKNGKMVFADEKVPYYSKTWTCKLRPATKEQRALLLQKIKEAGYKWNAETKTLEKLVKPKFKAGDRIRHKETNKDDVYKITKVYDDSYGIDGFTWMIYMKYQDQYELVPNKFDPKMLKPFDKVIVKYSACCDWRCDLFSHIIKSTINLYKCIKNSYFYCIPYNDDTKHLIGTTEEAPEYYRYWEK